MNQNFSIELFKWFLSLRLKKIKKIEKDPFLIQKRNLFKIIQKAQNTEFGKKFDFKSIKSILDFQKKVPINEYEDFSPFISRMMNGEANILWPGLIRNFSKSSGTTARSKFLPVSDQLLKNCFKAGHDQVRFYLQNNSNSRIFKGKSIFVGGNIKKIKEKPKIFCGDISAVMMRNLSFVVEYFRTPSLETAILNDFEIKLEKISEETINKNITSIAGAPTWTIALIKKVVEKAKVKNILEVWPNLEVFFHGAVSFEPYREVFKELIPTPHMHYLEAYNASEGFFAMQDDLSLPGEMLLMPDYGIFYEFIPINEYGKENFRVFTMADVQIGENYALIISTNAGLWRYSIGDTIEFTSLFPHRVKITGRTKHFLNTFGEEVLVHNTDMAISRTCQKTQASISEYMVCPIFMNSGKSGGHEWVVEFLQAPNSIEEFREILDSELRAINSDYDAKRFKDIILSKLVLHSAPPGTFYNWMKSKGKLGGQNKVPRLLNNRENVEEILKFF